MTSSEGVENRKFSFRLITVAAGINLVVAAERIWRGHTWKERSDVVLVVLFIFAVWTACLRLQRALAQVNDQMKGELLRRVADNAHMAVVFGYLSLLSALSLR